MARWALSISGIPCNSHGGGGPPAWVARVITTKVVDARSDAIGRFMELEKEWQLCDWVVGGVYVWDHLRFPLSQRVQVEMGAIGQAHTTLPMFERITKQIQGLHSAFWNNPFAVGQREIFFYGHPRRKLENDGLWWDIYSDPIIEALPWSYVYLEPPYLESHLSPARTEHIRYDDLLRLLGRLNTARIRRTDDIARELEFAGRLDRAIERLFGIRLELPRLVLQVLARRRAMLPLYRFVLRRVRPKVVILVCSYGKETFIEACKQENIPVIELQHGVIYEGHTGYSFPEGRSKRYFPDYFLSYGDFWINNVTLPVAKERVYSVGFPYLEAQHKQYHPKRDVSCSGRNLQILFLSQGTIGEELSKFAVSVREKLTLGYRIVFKLHPGEYARWRLEYPWLVRSDIDVIDTDQVSLYSLFSESDVQVGVYSTALYEGLTYDLETYLIDLPGINTTVHLARQGYASVVTSPDDFVNEILRLPAKGSRPDSGMFFRRNALARALRVIEEIKESEPWQR